MSALLRYTLVTDGTSDRALLPVLRWVLEQQASLIGRWLQEQWADLSQSSNDRTLAGRIRAALQFYPCDLIFVHRDAETDDRMTIAQRRQEIATAAATAGAQATTSAIPVIPIRMTEAWLLIDANAIRRAADNPNSRVAVSLPPVRQLESLSDPKQQVHELLIAVCEKQGRRLDQFKRELPARRVRIAEYIEDFAPLSHLAAFRQLLEDTAEAVALLPPAENEQ